MNYTINATINGEVKTVPIDNLETALNLFRDMVSIGKYERVELTGKDE